MINLEEEARKRRERLKSSLNQTNSPTSDNFKPSLEEKSKDETSKVTGKRSSFDHDSTEFTVPEGQVLLDHSGAEILSVDSKIPDTLEAQVKSLLAPQKDLLLKADDIIEPKDKNSDLKREYERRIANLNRQTKRSIVDIVRTRLEQEKTTENETNVEEEPQTK